jgi:hypothetical protein
VIDEARGGRALVDVRDHRPAVDRQQRLALEAGSTRIERE